jgi:two-component system cell cycle sensor histidine kinase/response regulator CckA
LSRAFERARRGEKSVVEADWAPLIERLGRWRLHVMPFRPETEIEALGIAFEDITEHALAAEAFEASERRFRTLVDGATDGIAVHRNGVLLYMNPAGIRMLGYSCADEVVGSPVLDFVHPEQRRAVSVRIAELGRSGRVGAVEEIFVRKDGSRIVVEASGCRVPLDDGLANFVFFRDVTERKQLETELNRMSRMESLGQLAGSIAHDFNNLLGIIRGSLGIARQRLDDPVTLRESLDAAEAAARRAADVTRQLLTFSRGDEARPTLTDPNRVVDEAVQLVTQAGGGGVHIDFRPNPSAGSLWLGPSQLHQIVLNLLLNARDALGEGGSITVRVERCSNDPSTKPKARPGEWLVLSVSDTGNGMDSATRARIFEPFFTTKAAGQGTGLGLSTVYGIVRQAGGFIDVSSAVGRGTSFLVYLPFVERKPESGVPASDPSQPA